MTHDPSLLSPNEYRAWQMAMATQYLPALKRVVDGARGPTHQASHLRHLLLAIYNSYDWALDMSRIRQIDHQLQMDVLAVIHWYALGDRELHTYLEDGEKTMRDLWEYERPEDFSPENGGSQRNPED